MSDGQSNLRMGSGLGGYTYEMPNWPDSQPRGRGGRGSWGRGGRGGRGRGGQSGYNNYNRYQKLDVGMKGFLCSTNFREKDCIKEAYNLLNEYSEVSTSGSDKKNTDKVVEPEASNTDKSSTDIELEQASAEAEDSSGSSPKNTQDDDEDDDIDKALKSEIKELKNERYTRKFQSVDTGINNLCFINAKIDDVPSLAHKILEDINTTKEQKSKHLVKMLPIEIICRGNPDDIKKAALEIFPKYFKDGFKSYQIIFKHRLSKLDRFATVKLLAQIVSDINQLNVVDLTDPFYTIIVEVIKNLCLIGVVKDFNKLKKYNLIEIIYPTVHKPKSTAVAGAGATTTESESGKKVEEIKEGTADADPTVASASTDLMCKNEPNQKSESEVNESEMKVEEIKEGVDSTDSKTTASTDLKCENENEPDQQKSESDVNESEMKVEEVEEIKEATDANTETDLKC